MIVPYGEALGHPYYLAGIARMSRMEQVTGISCQTNLSHNPASFIEQLTSEKADFSKLHLWATFHAEMTSKEAFAERVKALQAQLTVCVGVVGTPQMVEELAEMKALLPPHTYLWVNAMEGLGRRYTPDEIAHITAIDPLFTAELANPKANIDNCCAGVESLFVTATGEAYACNRSKTLMGNIYSNDPLDNPICKTRACDCFLAYVHRNDMKEAAALHTGKYFRVPKGIPVSTLFFDIDGTLTGEDGNISTATTLALKQLAQQHRIYLATARPFAHAMQKCKSIRSYLSGGVFANGADIRDFGTGYQTVVPMPEVVIPLKNNFSIFRYTKENTLYKIAVTGTPNAVSEVYKELQTKLGKQLCLHFEDGVLGITNLLASKLAGIIHLSDKLNIDHKQVMTVGNGENDIPMLSHFSHSVAVPSAAKEVKEVAAYSLAPEQLPVFLRPPLAPPKEGK